MNMNDFLHTTVLLHETVDGCLNDPQGIYVDGTFGRGGHSRLLLSKLGEQQFANCACTVLALLMQIKYSSFFHKP